MKKFGSLVILIVFMLIFSTSIFAMQGEIPTVSNIQVTTYTGPGYGIGIIQWLAYLLFIILIVITILKTIVMIKNKKAIGKILTFDLIMLILICLCAYGATILEKIL